MSETLVSPEPVRNWINDGLMVFFFLVAGLEARREFDMGELRRAPAHRAPAGRGRGGMIVPVRSSSRSTSGPFERGGLGHRDGDRHGLRARHSGAGRAARLSASARLHPDRRVFDDLIALVVIATAYSTHVSFCAARRRDRALVLAARASARLGARSLAGLDRSGLGRLGRAVRVGDPPDVHRSRAGPRDGRLRRHARRSRAATAARAAFREQPTPELAREARLGSRRRSRRTSALRTCCTRGRATWSSRSSRSRTPARHHDGLLAQAVRSPITIGIFVAYVVGKPVGILSASWLAHAR